MARVMIVDDSKVVRHYLSQMVELADHTAIQVESGEKALELLEVRAKSEPALLPDLIFMDVLMSPGMSGIETTSKIKSSPVPAIAEIPVVFLTGIGEQDIVSKALDAGAIDYMVKPSSAESLPIFLSNLRKKLDRLLTMSTRSLKRGAGLIADLSNEYLPSLLQMLHLEDASGYATLTNPKKKQSASMHIRYGNIEHLVLVDTSKGIKTRIEGEEAFRMMVKWTEGVFSFGRADPERMPKGKPMNLVTLLCSVDSTEIEGVTARVSREEPKVPVFESYTAFKTGLEKELTNLVNETQVDSIHYVRLNKGKASILLKGFRSNPPQTPLRVFKDNHELVTFVKQKAPDLNSGKFKEIFYFLDEGYIVIRKGTRIDYVVLIGQDQDNAKQGRLSAARAATMIRKAAIERRNKRITHQQTKLAAVHN
ncbi:response regulator receiver protein [Candidatus Vecturithrix granuli]|uniref:Response regulator receiver protein n=1 Tax=Vecturithrix granuli TaxID=1499967 RepID=A0A081BYM2_VECG1|nr:response regulator receiver protein [Candidatus Vecturithrix granuli]